MTRLSCLAIVAAVTFAILGMGRGHDLAAQTVIGVEADIVRAIRAGDLPRVKSLVIQGSNPSTADSDGLNGIAIAARNGDYAMVEYLLTVDVPINAQDEIGNSALLWATEDGDVDMAQFLIKNGADVNVRNRRGLTPTMVAARSGYRDMVELYIDNNADLNVRDYTGRGALDWARDSRTPGMEQVLLNAGAQ
ncbi:MAG: ankyrin repeat domain-containing protein [Alphaproteobacteria bacterium]|jgi:ankyrin repeat protein|uniref:ankyrin repeat domain-containing protein n=1 Tax=Pacificispira sp. TaxID=2888761 RepID=UPI001B176B80|nr:ankyrin repeat domain-containing protein [Alphaproteobacteria bacterium]MBO6861367.1 ankyrin repeat domain-containing protein [Alphaproteobacteria bacterium]MEC9268642.1 ankyrin repeat domain-containing protein [Pseudomonadota bacterium]